MDGIDWSRMSIGDCIMCGKGHALVDGACYDCRTERDVVLASGRIVHHVRDANGSQFAFATAGPKALTAAEHADYCEQRRQRAVAAGHVYIY